MIKYVDLTAPEASAFRQAKILSIECQEGDLIKEGDTLFRVQSGAHEINLPSTKTGRIIEVIAGLQENITLSTALLLLETEVKGSTASQPINPDIQSSENSFKESQQPDESKPRKDSRPKKTAASNSNASHQANTLGAGSKPSKKTKNARKKNKKVVKKKHTQQSLDLMGGDLFEPNESTEQLNEDNNEVVLTRTAAPTANERKPHSQPSPTMPSSSLLK